MNDPLEHKLFSVYGLLLKKDLLNAAWKRVKKNGGCAGIDKVSIKDFEKDLDTNLEEILTSLKEKTYTPTPVARKYIRKKNGKLRPLGIPTIRDRVVQMALTMVLTPFFEENVFHDNSCGFRPNRSPQSAIERVCYRLEAGYLYIYDMDIKGFFDNIPHKQLMRVLNKYIADGTVLQMIWKWLKAGYMEDNIVYEQPAGTQQGGVISPLIANIYLNELDWELDKAGFQFVRYADDCIVMCHSLDALEKAKGVVGRTLEALGLELSPEKTHDVNFRREDFDYLGFTFTHFQGPKNKASYYIKPTAGAIKKFRSDLKGKTCKTFTKSSEKWAEDLNSVLRGKFDYFLIPFKALENVRYWRKQHSAPTRGIAAYSHFGVLDAYVRGRLRVCFANRGRKSARLADGKMLNYKYDNAFFLKKMKLVSGLFMVHSQFLHKGISEDDFLKLIKPKKKRWRNNNQLFAYMKAK